MHPTQTRRESFLHVLSTFLLCCAILLLGSISDAAAQQRSEAWKKRAQRSRQQYEQYMERQPEQIRAFAREQKKEFQAMIERARQAGIPRRLKNDAGETVAVLYRFPETGPPTYVSPDNEQSAEIINTKQLWPSSFSDWSLTGLNQDVGLWEFNGRPMESHQEFESLGNSRVQYEDDESAAPDSHATHVAGTMIAEGEKDKAHGMAPEAEVYAWESDNDTGEMASASFNETVQLSNHSYGPDRGWDNLENGPKGSGWYWYGDISVDVSEDFEFGFYNETAFEWDEVVHNNEYFLPVTSAGNDRDDGPSSQPVTHWYYNYIDEEWVQAQYTERALDCGQNGYDCLAGPAVAKNPIVVGALKDDGTTPADFSAFGPTDDGRIKPDLMANGVSVYSSVTGSNSSYGTKTGTSMAAPAVTGSIALLKELLGSAEYRASTLKAILLHTADDEIGPKSGPDYKTGWGRMNSERAAEVIEAEVTAIDTLHVIDHVTLDERALQGEIDSLKALLSSAEPSTIRGSSAGIVQTLHQLNGLTLLKSRVEQVRRGKFSAPTGAFPGGQSDVHSLVEGYATAGTDGTAESRRVRDAARRLLVENMIRTRHFGRALSDARTYAKSMSTRKGRAQMHLHRAAAYARQEQYDQALQAVDAAEKAWAERSYASRRMLYLRRSGDPRWREIAKEQREQNPAEKAATNRSAQPKKERPSPDEFALGTPYPNPASSAATLSLALPGRARVRAVAYDVLGRRISVLVDRSFAAGRPDLKFSTEGLAGGLYMVRVVVSPPAGKKHVFTDKVTVVK